MQSKIKAILLVLTLSSFLIVPASAQTKEVGIYGIWPDQTSYEPGQTITVTLEIGWDFPSETDIGPGVYDTLAEVYIAEDIYTVIDSGFGNITLSFTAPSSNGVYEYLVNVFYDEEGWIMSDTGYEEHYIYIQVGSTGSGQYSAWVTDVDAPSRVAPGELFNVTVSVQISFPQMTLFAVAVSDPETGEAILEVEDQAVGDQTGSYWFEIAAPETEGDYTLGADIVFETPQGWSYSDDSTQTFDITVSSDSNGGGAIPGFPMVSVLLGSLVALALVLRKPEL